MVQRIEVGLVSADTALVDFYAGVFALDPLPSVESGSGVVHRLAGPGTVIKVMVPSNPPSSAEPVMPFFAITGLRYLTMFVDDLDAILERSAARAGRLQHGPLDLAPGVRLAILQDPDGNAIEVVEGAP